ncbi:MAG: hypothetical protein HIU81_08565, partial [Acidobacteria bacterium]|nr:hypothetical protein [Acidobacteriota bacterium]
HIGLVLLAAIMIGFWQFHVATIVAAIPDERRRRHHLTRARAAIAVAGIAVVLGFVSSNVPVTSHDLPLVYGNQPGMQVFIWAGSAFIIWVCTDAAVTFFRFLPALKSQSFKAGVTCFAFGCMSMVIALGNRLALGSLEANTEVTAPASSVLNTTFPIFETVAVLLVSAGLAFPRYTAMLAAARRNLRARTLMVALRPISSTSGRSQRFGHRYSVTLDPLLTNPLGHLHRRVITIRDDQLRGMMLLPRDRVLVSAAEELLR